MIYNAIHVRRGLSAFEMASISTNYEAANTDSPELHQTALVRRIAATIHHKPITGQRKNTTMTIEIATCAGLHCAYADLPEPPLKPHGAYHAALEISHD